MTTEDQSVQKTHLSISEELVGKVVKVETGVYAEVTLTVNEKMKADQKGLIHGGFTFGLADYAAMVAVNDPFVVLLASDVRFLKPVVIGDRLTARARISPTEGRKQKVSCDVINQNQEKVLGGEFLCMTLDKHVLER